MTGSDDLMEHLKGINVSSCNWQDSNYNDQQVSMGPSEHRDIHGHTIIVRFIEPDPEIPFTAQHQQNKHS